ncbi:serine hydrolase domain-containing protein [Nocardiopsis sp. NPDC101807]|uniref:serine hydrolase domain-containing protein n=1 Tax=Nocardiopsis sp. NPDC101807 TaxID=3364339 RepID=UPI0038263CA7
MKDTGDTANQDAGGRDPAAPAGQHDRGPRRGRPSRAGAVLALATAAALVLGGPAAAAPADGVPEEAVAGQDPLQGAGPVQDGIADGGPEAPPGEPGPAPGAADRDAGSGGDGAGGVDAAELDAFITAHLERVGLPGATVAVTRGDRVVHTGGYGHDGNGEPLRADSPMRIASLSKSMTALAVMQLVEGGAVDLDDPVRDHLPEFTTADPRGDLITVRQLLDQSSGLSDRGHPDVAGSPQPATLAEAVARLRDAELTSAPGERWQYHNPNYQVAARLVEVVSGEPFAEYLERHVFAPAGMDDTRSPGPDAPGPRAHGGGARPGPAPGHIRAFGANVPVAEPPAFGTGSGDVVSTAEDMARWLLLQVGGGRAPGGERLLSAEGVELTHTPSAPGGRYGLGWIRRESADGSSGTRVWHGGALSTYSSYQVLVPGTGYGVVALFNSGITLTENDAWGLVEGVLDLTEGRTPAGADSSLWKVDAAFGAATLTVAGLGVLGVRRAGAWAGRRAGPPRWRTALRLLPYALPPLLFPLVNPVITWVMGGREGTWLQRFYGIPAALAFVAATALVCLAVLAARTAALVRAARRPAGAVGAADAPAPSGPAGGAGRAGW